MSFIKKDFVDLYLQLESNSRQLTPQISDFQEGSVIRSLFESFAIELATLYEQMELVYQAGFVDTAEEANLERVVAILGIKRNEPDFATGEVTFVRDQGSVDTLIVPMGTLVTTEEAPVLEESEGGDLLKKAYLTIEEGLLAVGESAVTVKVQAETRGRELATDAETVTVMPRPVPGIKYVTNSRPIRFLGRDRESDEALRQRAKQVLLSSGRASITSIENALLSMPGVRAVRIHEDPTRPGLIQVYVDGLTERNRGALQKRIDEVRAAGIFVALAPAQPIHLTLVLRIAVDPRVKGEEQVAVEQAVSVAVEAFVANVPMGQPLLFSQLTAEVLAIPGVVDLEDFKITATRPAGSTPTAPPAHYTLTARRIEASLFECFVPQRVRVAASIKPLPIDVQAQVTLPSSLLRSRLVARYQNLLGAQQQTAALQATAAVAAVPPFSRAAVINELQRFYSTVSPAVTVVDWEITLEQTQLTSLAASIHNFFVTVQQANPTGGGRVAAKELVAHLQQRRPGNDSSNVWLDWIERRQTEWLTQFHEKRMAEFPAQTLDSHLRAYAITAYQSALNQARTRQQVMLDAATAAFQRQSTELDITQSGDQRKLIAAQLELSHQQQAANDTFRNSELAAAEARDAALSGARALVEALQTQTQQALQALIVDTFQEMQSFMRAVEIPIYDIAVRLRTTLFDQEILADVEFIEASFVETPQPNLLFVYTDRLELAGRLQLTMPARVTAAEKEHALYALRTDIANYLETLHPDQELDLDEFRSVILAHGQVALNPTTLHLLKLHHGQRSEVPGRTDGNKLKILTGEKLFLSPEPWFAIEVQQ